MTSLLKSGDNAVGAMLGNGWYRGELGWEDRRNLYGKRLGLLCQIEIRYNDGRREVVGTDQGWKASTGPILMSEIYHGETYDARLEKAGWATAGFDDRAVVGGQDGRSLRKDALIAPAGPPVRRIEELKPVKVFKTPAGDTVADLGQNMVGWVRLRSRARRARRSRSVTPRCSTRTGTSTPRTCARRRRRSQYTLKGGGSRPSSRTSRSSGSATSPSPASRARSRRTALTGIVIHSADGDARASSRPRSRS